MRLLLLELEGYETELMHSDPRGYIHREFRRQVYVDSTLHQAYLDYTQKLVGDLITREQLSRLNPWGGMTGPDECLELPRESGVGSHAVYHDALGWLYVNFGVGRGYGFLNPGQKLAGQIGGLAREIPLIPVTILRESLR